jgi:hypothetical protein
VWEYLSSKLKCQVFFLQATKKISNCLFDPGKQNAFLAEKWIFEPYRKMQNRRLEELGDLAVSPLDITALCSV